MDAEGQRLPSVTTILNATRSQAQRQALQEWRQRVGVETAAQISSAASKRGTGTHRQIQRYLRGEAPVCSETVQPYWESIWPVLQDLNDIRLVESPVFHYALNYAGQPDCVASYRGVPCLCEWKTADRPKQSLERLHDYPLQLAAYWGAVNHFFRDQNLCLDQAILVVAVPQMPAEVFLLESSTLLDYWAQWEQRLGLYQRRQQWNR
jgi:hypothetical protein